MQCGHFGGSGLLWSAVWLFWDASSSSPRQLDGDVFVELDVGSEGNGDEVQLGAVLRDLLAGGSIASYLTSPKGFQFRRLGAGEPGRGFGGSLRGFLGCSGAVWGRGGSEHHIPIGVTLLAVYSPWPNSGGGCFGVIP